MNDNVQDKKKNIINNKKKDINEFKITDVYKYDIKDDEINELNKIIDKLDEEDDKKTLNEIIKNNNLEYDNTLKLKHILKKINNTKNRYSTKNEKENNKDINEDIQLSYSFIYFCKESEKKLLSDNNKIYTCKRCDKKIGNLSYKSAKIILNEIITNKKKNENYEIDNSIKNYYDKITFDDLNKINDYIIYHRIKIFDKQMSNLFNEIKFSFSKIMNNILKDYYENINKNINGNINENNKKIICENIYNILMFIKEKINNQDKLTHYKEKYIKSKGELITSIFLILYFGASFNINTEPLTNTKTNRKLELDFYFDDSNLAIEVDGGHHNDLKQKKTDLIKNFLCEDQNVKLIRIDTSNNKKDNKIIKELFENIKIFTDENNITINKNITEDNIISIFEYFKLNYYFENEFIIKNNNSNNNLNKNELIENIKKITDEKEINNLSKIFNDYLNEKIIKNKCIEYKNIINKINEEELNKIIE
jgi:hypothetical protein